MIESRSYKAYLESPYKSIKHSTYFEVYDELFTKYVDKNIVFIEIGVLSGGSLFMWRNFFGQNARIIGIDLNPGAKKWVEHGFEIYIGSQSDATFLEQTIQKIGPVDVILDDGGHTYVQQIVSTETLLPWVRDGGLLVVEDTHTSYMKGFGNRKYSFIKYTKNMVDKLNLRFSLFASTNSDRRVWSVQTFESIVAFHINQKATELISEPTDNQGVDDFAEDFRHHCKNDQVSKTNTMLRFLAYLPGSRSLYSKFTNFELALKKGKSNLRKFF